MNKEKKSVWGDAIENMRFKFRQSDDKRQRFRRETHRITILPLLTTSSSEHVWTVNLREHGVRLTRVNHEEEFVISRREKKQEWREKIGEERFSKASIDCWIAMMVDTQVLEGLTHLFFSHICSIASARKRRDKVDPSSARLSPRSNHFGLYPMRSQWGWSCYLLLPRSRSLKSSRERWTDLGRKRWFLRSLGTSRIHLLRDPSCRGRRWISSQTLIF